MVPPDDAQKEVSVHLPHLSSCEWNRCRKARKKSLFLNLLLLHSRLHNPSKELSEDEMVIGFYGRLKRKQFEPAKYHIKSLDHERAALVIVTFLPTMYQTQCTALIWIEIAHRPKRLRSISVLSIKATASVTQCHFSTI